MLYQKLKNIKPTPALSLQKLRKDFQTVNAVRRIRDHDKSRFSDLNKFQEFFEQKKRYAEQSSAIKKIMQKDLDSLYDDFREGTLSTLDKISEVDANLKESRVKTLEFKKTSQPKADVRFVNTITNPSSVDVKDDV